MRQINVLLVAFLLLVTQMVIGQRTVTGLVQDGNTLEPLIGASVLLTGNSSGTVTGLDGRFSIKVPNDVLSLTVSYTGYQNQVVSIIGINEVLVSLDAGELLDEVVVTGYTTQKKKDITGAISIVSAQELENISTPNVISKLQSQVPGLSFNSSGAPGGSDTQISIRGLTSVFGGVGPLWVIDGVQTSNPAGLNPNEIESIQVLKDAAAAGIYGTEAARGVVIVTTKQATKGQSGFSLNSRITFNSIREDFKVLGGQEWLDVRYAAQGNKPVVAGNFEYIPGMQLPGYLDNDNNLRLSNTNWVDEVMGNSTSTTTDLGYSRATEDFRVYAGAGYASDNGIMQHTYYNRRNIRLNASIDLFKDRLTIGENFTLSNFNEVKQNVTEDALLQNPLIPVYGEDGSWGGPTGGGLQDKWNPVARLHIARNNEENTNRYFGNVYGELKITKGLFFKSTLNFDGNRFRYDEHTEFFDQNGSLLGNRFVIGNEAVQRFERRRNNANTMIWTNLIRFDRDFNQHTINAFAGYEMFKNDQDNTYNRVEVPEGTNVDFENIEQYKIIADNTFLDAYGIGPDSRRLSQFLKVGYDYADKYYVAASVRRDGSSRFGRNNRYAVFPTLSLGWTLSQEDFLKKLSTINDLKLRFSWGGNGNADILEYAQYSIFQQAIENANYDLNGRGNGGIFGGVSPNQIGNPDLKWEQSYQTNLGMDLSMFNYQVKFVLDVYQKNTSDLLLQVVQPSVLGEAGSTLFFNAGDMTNKGIDLGLSYKSNRSGDFNYGIGFTFSAYRNEVTKLNNEDNFILEGVSYTGVGQSIGSYFGYVADGIFRTPEEVAVHAQQPGKALGNIRYRDLNGDAVINQDDRTIIGNPHPDFTYGINLDFEYKNWGLNFFFDGRQGNDMYNIQRELLDFTYFGFNHGRNTLDAWAPDNANSLIPRLNTADVNDQRRASTYFVEDGSFFRLRTVTLGYDLSKGLLKNSRFFRSARIYVQGENLLNWSSFTGFDYEVPGLSRTGIGIAGLGTYPHTKSISAGVNLDF